MASTPSPDARLREQRNVTPQTKHLQRPGDALGFQHRPPQPCGQTPGSRARLRRGRAPSFQPPPEKLLGCRCAGARAPPGIPHTPRDLPQLGSGGDAVGRENEQRVPRFPSLQDKDTPPTEAATSCPTLPDRRAVLP